jgi:hypothetical protein
MHEFCFEVTLDRQIDAISFVDPVQPEHFQTPSIWVIAIAVPVGSMQFETEPRDLLITLTQKEAEIRQMPTSLAESRHSRHTKWKVQRSSLKLCEQR